MAMLFAQVIVKQRTRVEELTYAITPVILPYVAVGSSVRVPLGRKEVIGVITGFKKNISQDLRLKIRPVKGVADELALYSSQQLAVIRRLAKEYGATVAEVAFHALGWPAGVRPDKKDSPRVRFLAGSFAKRLAYYRQLFTIYSRKKHMLFLFSQKAYAISCWRSLTEHLPSGMDQPIFSDNRLTVNRQIKAAMASNRPQTVVGTLKDAFLPLNAGDLLIIDQPDHLGAMTDQRPFLTSKKIGLIRAEVEGLHLILADVLPTVTDWLAISNHWWPIAYAKSEKKTIFIANRQRQKELIMPSILAKIDGHLSKGGRVLALVLSRGWAGALVCGSCGLIFHCRRCQRSTALSPDGLECRYCGQTQSVPAECPNCQGQDLKPVGEGVMAVEEHLAQHFPSTKVSTLSKDQPKFPQTATIIVATEKILAFTPVKFDLLAIISVDRLLSGANLDGAWRLLTDLIELGSWVGETVVQTLFPDHLVWSSLTGQKWPEFYRNELIARRQFKLPPYGSQFELIGSGHRLDRLTEQAGVIIRAISQELPGVTFSPPQIRDRSGKMDYLAVTALISRLMTYANKRSIAAQLPPNWAVRY